MEDKHLIPYSIDELQEIQQREQDKRKYKVISDYVFIIYDTIMKTVKHTEKTNFSCVLEEKTGSIRYRFNDNKYQTEVISKENNMKGNISQILVELDILFPDMRRSKTITPDRDEKTGESHLIVDLYFDWS